MLFPELFHRLHEAGATEVKFLVLPGPRECAYRLTWAYAGNQYGYQHIVSDIESAASLSVLEYTLQVLSDNALISIRHAKFIAITKESKMKYVSVNFSGATAIYNYSFDPTFHDNPAVGDRVVVPTKMKIDGTVTLTIATVVSFSNEPLPGADKPVIDFLPNSAIAEATAICASLEAKRVQAIS